MVKPLPPLNAVRAFEAASRHLNLSRAAEELSDFEYGQAMRALGGA